MDPNELWMYVTQMQNICSTLIHLCSTFSWFVSAPLLSSLLFLLLFSSPLSLLQYMICHMRLTLTHDTNAIILLEPFLLFFIFKHTTLLKIKRCFFKMYYINKTKIAFKQSQWFLYFSFHPYMFFSHWKPLVQPPPPSLHDAFKKKSKFLRGLGQWVHNWNPEPWCGSGQPGKGVQWSGGRMPWVWEWCCWW